MQTMYFQQNHVLFYYYNSARKQADNYFVVMADVWKMVDIKSIHYLWMNEWIMHIYSTLLCIVVHPKYFTIIWGVSHLFYLV